MPVSNHQAKPPPPPQTIALTVLHTCHMKNNVRMMPNGTTLGACCFLETQAAVLHHHPPIQ